MKKFERLAETTAPDGSSLILYRHDTDYVIRAGGVELMTTRRHHSEEQLATLVCAPLAGRPAARVLVGGLGFGFTLRAALAALPRDAEVVVAELLEAVIAWNRDPAFGLAGAALADPRVVVRRADVLDLLRADSDGFDGIMLDVDNGADALVTAGNARLYGERGLRLTADRLRPGGRVAWWAAEPDPAFEKAVRRAGLRVEMVKARAHATSGAWHVVYVAEGRGKGAGRW